VACAAVQCVIISGFLAFGRNALAGRGIQVQGAVLAAQPACFLAAATTHLRRGRRIYSSAHVSQQPVSIICQKQLENLLDQG